MLFKKLGNTSVKIPAIGLGTSGSGSYANADLQREEQSINLYRCAIDFGLTYFDTAELYGGGYAEEILGKAVAGIRDRVFIASKFNPNNNSFEGVMKSIEVSLKRLNTNYIDLYQIHWPNPLIPISETMAALEKLVEQGKIRYIGVSNFCLDDLKEAQSFLGKGQIVSMQVEYNLLDRTIEQELLSYCAKNNITVIAYSPLNQGRLVWQEDQKEIFYALAKKYAKTPAQIALRFLILHPSIVALTRTRNIDHLSEIATLADFTIEDEDRDTISRLFKKKSISVPTEKIRVKGIDTRPSYASVQEAIENKLDLIPSPMILAKNILLRGKFKPIRLVATEDRTGKYDYDLDGYDLMGEVKKYWAWMIAHGANVPIPAYYLI